MKLNDWLSSRGKSAKECADFLGISEPAFSGYVTGKTQPRLDVAIKIVNDLTAGEVRYADLVLPKNRQTEEDEL